MYGRCPLTGALLACAMLVPVHKAGAETKQIELGREAEVRARPTQPGTFDLQLVNVIPKKTYTVAAEILTASITVPEPLSAQVTGGDACDVAFSEFRDKAKEATSEEAVAAARAAAIGQTDADCKKRINTIAVLDVGPFTVGERQTIKYSIKRPKQGDLNERDFGSWTFNPPTESPGTWLTFYGVNYIDSGDDEYFSKAGTDTPVTYTITEKVDRSERDFAPSLYFMWFKEENHKGWAKALSWNNEDVFGGVTAGIGFDFDNPTAFLGYGVGWGYNVLLTAGVAMHKEKRLNGRYQPGEVIGENLSEAQLAEETYKPRAYIGVAFRFGSNPFKKETPTPAPAPTK